MLDPASRLMRGLTEALVLESLHREPKHGYGLMKELEETFGEAPNRNRIYPLLSRLEEEGYIEGAEDPESSRGKTTYTLTDDGEDRLAEYEATPEGFREALERLWGPVDLASPPAETGSDDGDGEGEEPPEGGDGGDEEDDGADGGEGDGEAGGPPPLGGLEAAAGDGPEGLDLRRNPETGNLELVIRGTPWGPIRLDLGGGD